MLPYGVSKREAEQSGRRPGQIAMQRLDSLVDIGFRLQRSTIAKVVEPGLAVGFIGFQLFIQRASQNSQLITKSDVITE